MAAQVAEEVEKKLKTVGFKPTSEDIKSGIIAQVSGTHYHVLSYFSNTSFSDVASNVNKDIAKIFPAYDGLVRSLEKLPENLNDNQRRIINDKIEEISKTIKRDIVENVSVSDKLTPEKISAAEVQKKTNLDWILSNPSELEQYIGKYVAIENAKVVGSGNTSIEALTEARRDDPSRKVLLKLVSDTDIGL
jgi:hypothetical protein